MAGCVPSRAWLYPHLLKEAIFARQLDIHQNEVRSVRLDVTHRLDGRPSYVDREAFDLQHRRGQELVGRVVLHEQDPHLRIRGMKGVVVCN